MSSPPMTNTEQRSVLAPELEALLQAEIGFWQEVIATCPVSQPGETLERMHLALALAESKLARLTGSAGAGGFTVSRTH